MRGGEKQGRAQRVNLLTRFHFAAFAKQLPRKSRRLSNEEKKCSTSRVTFKSKFHYVIYVVFRFFTMYVVFRCAMAPEGEEEVSDDQESETEECDTEEDEGKII